MTESAPTFFDTLAPNWAANYQIDPRFARRRDQILSLLEKHVFRNRSQGRALDFGCGAGVFSRAMLREGWSVLGIDASQGMIEAARAQSNGSLAGQIEFK